ncbi:unnamed protein product [Brachionus calyciflorus]|uniref:Uncharacterized protein n=1 Tax=Brachionus calyciflorus TaxID=104777 RepID=A0A814M949_9BILA|nr:unnamed protein product [Brachionus calyciflorus]
MFFKYLILLSLGSCILSLDDRRAELLTKDLIYRINKALIFFERNYELVNVDGLFGIRAAQGAFLNFKYKQLDPKLNLTLTSLTMRLSTLSKKIYDNLSRLPVDYVSNFELLINKPFIPKLKIRNGLSRNKIFFIEKFYKSQNQEFNEKFSDLCYSNILKKKNVDFQCLDYFTIDSASGYYLTHQLLFFIIADYTGYFSNTKEKLIEFLSHNSDRNLAIFLNNERNDFKTGLFKYYCNSIYIESDYLYKTYENANDFPQDLFIEQLFLCGSLGFSEFLKPKWLKLIFSFQNKNGCFNEKANEFDSNIEYLDFNEILDMIILRSSKTNERSKRYDSIMEDFCSAHETGLALAFFSLFLKSLI